MNMLNDKAENFHPPHKLCYHLSQIEWDAVERLSSTIAQEAVAAMLFAVSPDRQHATIVKLIHNELDDEGER